MRLELMGLFAVFTFIGIAYASSDGWRLLLIVVFACVALLFACSGGAVRPKPSVAGVKEWPQRCEMCGAEWLVVPVASTDEVPPTVEWCYLDGMYCDVGIGIVAEEAKHGKTRELEKRFLSHCLECKGCRYSAFEPDEWHAIMVAIKNIGAKDGSASE